MTSKIRIRMGQVEVEFEGSEEFLRNDLLNLLTTACDLYNNQSIIDEVASENEDRDLNTSPHRSYNSSLKWSTATIAAKLGVKNGKHLVIAACTHLHFESNQESFTRAQILDEMKKATGYYQQNYSKNLSRYIQQLMKDGTIIESAKHTYALSASRLISLEQELDR